MTISTDNTLSLLQSLLAERAGKTGSGRTAEKTDQTFAERLEKALGPTAAEGSAQTVAQSLAETLNLQMLHTTLALASEETAPQMPRIMEQERAALKSLLSTYYGAQAATSPPQTQAQVQASTRPPAQSLLNIPPEPVSVVKTTRPAANSGPIAAWLEPIIAKASRKYGIDAGLIKAVIKTESNFNPTAVSHAGARGLMQLMPGTARALGVTDSFDPEQNVMGGTKFLRDMLDRYNGNLDSALAAYNWGPGNVDRRPDRMPRETREYLVRVKQLYTSYTG